LKTENIQQGKSAMIFGKETIIISVFASICRKIEYLRIAQTVKSF